MNEYKITYTCIDPNEDGSTQRGDRRIIERTEAAARAAAKKAAKEAGRPIQIDGCELISTNACATKQQERDTLAKIKAMVEELGPQSYVATAFEGCFEDAEENIDNDFGFSWKQRAESTGKTLDEANKKITALELDNRDLRLQIDRIKQELADAEQQLRDKALTPDDLTDCGQLVGDVVTDAEAEAQRAAAEIVKLADTPESPDFQQAVRDHRNALNEAAYYRALGARIAAAQRAGA